MRLVDDCQPGFVESEFPDANLQLHPVIDKALVFTDQFLWSDSQYPQPDTMRCEVLEERFIEDAHSIGKITTGIPAGVESTTGPSEFWVNESEPIQ